MAGRQRTRIGQRKAILALLVLCGALLVLANPVMSYLQQATLALHTPGGYIEEVLGK